MAGLVEILVVLASVAIWSAALHGHATHSAASGPTGASAQTVTSSSTVPASGDPCQVVTLGQGRCPTRPECYDQVQVADRVARARPLDCVDRHTWEVFALGDLPEGVIGAEYAEVRDDIRIKAVCSATTLARVSGFDVVGWQVEVLPPTPDALRTGDHTYRCLAGRGPGKLIGSTISRPSSHR